MLGVTDAFTAAGLRCLGPRNALRVSSLLIFRANCSSR